MVQLDFVEIADLPVHDGLIDYRAIQMKAQHSGYGENLFLLCSALQQIYSSKLSCLKSSRTFLTYLGEAAKKLLKIQRQKFILTTKWSLILGIVIEWDHCLRSFKINLSL